MFREGAVGGWASPVATLPPSYLGVLNKESSAMAVGALGTLPAAGTADAAHAALTAHAIPVTCCRGQKQRGQSPSWPCQQLTGRQPAKARCPPWHPGLPSRRTYLGCLGSGPLVGAGHR